MDDCEGLRHTKWECKYHVVFIPKGRRKKLYKQLRQHLGEVFRRLAQQKESQILEGHLIVDHVHMLIIDPAQVCCADRVHQRECDSADGTGAADRISQDRHFWARGYFASTVGRDETAIREYIRRQEAEDRRLGCRFD